MLATVWFLNGDLRHFASGGEDKIGVLNAILTAISHADNKGAKRRSVEQVADTGFHQAERSVEVARCPLQGSAA